MVTQGPLMVMVYLFLTTQWSVENPESAQEFQSDVKSIQTQIVGSESLASAWVDSTSALYKWEGYKDYFDLTDSVRDAYGYLYRGEVEQELARRDAILESESGQTWVGFVDQGLLATAIDQHARAAECFEKAISLNHHINNAPLRVLAGESHLKRGLLANAQVQFASAIAKAESSGDRAFIFRVRQECVDALFDHGHLEAAVERAYLHYDTDYPLEKSWLLAQEIMYLWSQDDVESAALKVAELASQIQDATYSETSHWEKKKYKQVQGLLTMSQKTLEGDPLYSMMMAVEAADFIYKRGEIDLAFENLEPWVAAYPTRDHSTFTSEEKEWSLWAKYNVCVILNAYLRLDESEAILTEILKTVPEEENKKLVAMSWCVLGQCFALQRRHHEALTAFESGLELDASTVENIPDGIVDLRSQPSVQGGSLSNGSRAAFVREYETILAGVEN